MGKIDSVGERGEILVLVAGLSRVLKPSFVSYEAVVLVIFYGCLSVGSEYRSMSGMSNTSITVFYQVVLFNPKKKKKKEISLIHNSSQYLAY